jgi:choline dehydrogenase-like flavoprotein
MRVLGTSPWCRALLHGAFLSVEPRLARTPAPVSGIASDYGTAKMRRDDLSVVDARLKVYGIDNLRIADGSIMPRVTIGNTMAPCVVIGERAAEILREEHRI